MSILLEARMKLHLGKIAFVAAAAAFVTLAPARADAQGMGGMTPAGIKVDTTSLGPTLATTAGMTLYTYGSDTVPGKSMCNGQCATNWPAASASADAKAMGDWSVVTRDDGSKQWAYKGKPLYTFKNDAKAGDVMGNGRGKWMAAKP
jgi:predicted lipoprotein with Yx(FWY)xxD motif